MFEYLKKLTVTEDNTAEFPLEGLEGVDGKAPVLVCRCASPQINRQLFNAVQRQLGSTTVEDDTFEAQAAGRVRDAALAADYVVVGWRNVLGDDSKPLAFSRDHAHAFLEALAVHVPYRFDTWRIWSRNPRNFVKGTVDAARVAGNSERA